MKACKEENSQANNRPSTVSFQASAQFRDYDKVKWTDNMPFCLGMTPYIFSQGYSSEF
jgi:hypothetical protein